jgi:hypothetical protein
MLTFSGSSEHPVAAWLKYSPPANLLRLIGQVITMSLETVGIGKALPELAATDIKGC